MWKLLSGYLRVVKYHFKAVPHSVNFFNNEILNIKKLEKFYFSISLDKKIESKALKDKIIEKHTFPKANIATKLEQDFPDPKILIDQIFDKLSSDKENCYPDIAVSGILGNRLTRVTLYLKWPGITSVVGIHKDEQKATHLAYLQACELLKNIGLIELKPELKTCTVDRVIKVFEEITHQLGPGAGVKQIYKVTHCQDTCSITGHIVWQSTLKSKWPVSFTVFGKSQCMEAAYTEACFKAIMKLKSIHYLDRNNQVKIKGMLKINMYKNRPVNKIMINPDFQVYVDASAKGMGAFLISKDDTCIRWMSDPWQNDKMGFDPLCNTALAEFYALVTAIYTWKNKMTGKSVICYTDSSSTAQHVNNGYLKKTSCCKHAAVLNLSSLLRKVCLEKDIDLMAQHVPRTENEAADLLSRFDSNKFKKLYPTARKNPIKSKKLWFTQTKIGFEPYIHHPEQPKK